MHLHHQQALLTLLLLVISLVDGDNDDDGQMFFTATQTAVYAGVSTVCSEQDSTNFLTTFFRYPLVELVAANGTKLLVTQPQSGGNALRFLLPNGSTATAPANMFSPNGATGELVVSSAIEPMSQSYVVSSTFRLIKLMSGSAPVTAGLATTVVCGTTTAANGNDGGCLTVATFAGPLYLAALTPTDAIAAGGARVLFVGDGSTVRVVNMETSTLTTLCGIWTSTASSVDGACSTALLRTIGAISVTYNPNSKKVIVYVVQKGDGYLRRLQATVNTAIPTDRSAWTIATIGPSRINDLASSMSMSMSGGPLAVFYSSSEGTAFSWSQGVGIQQIGLAADGYSCTSGNIASSNFRTPSFVAQSNSTGASSADQSILLADSACCTVTNISGTWQAASSFLRVKLATPFPQSSAGFSGYSSIDGVCSDGSDSGVGWVFITNGRYVVISTLGSTFDVVDTALTDVRNCVVIQNSTHTIAYLMHQSSYMISAVDVVRRTYLGPFCGSQLYGVTSGPCKTTARFTGVRSAYFDSATQNTPISASNPLGFWVGDGSSLRYVMVTNNVSGAAPNITTLGTVVNGNSIVGIAASPTYVYVATEGTVWCSCILRSAASAIYRGTSSSAVLTQVAGGSFANYFNPATVTIGFAYYRGNLILATNQHTDMPGILVSVPVDAAAVSMSLLRVVAGAASDTTVYATSNISAGVSPMLMMLSSVSQVQLAFPTNTTSGNLSSVASGVAVPDSSRALVWMLSYVAQPTVAAPMCTIAANCSAHALSAVLISSSTICNCTCLNQWSGQDCSVCPPRYNVINESNVTCGSCAQGFSDYPSCFPVCTVAGNCSDHASNVSGNSHSGCVCQCINAWGGDNCSVCAFPLSAAANCAECVRGYAGYPNCTRSSLSRQFNATHSSTNDVSNSESGSKTHSVSFSLTAAVSHGSLSASTRRTTSLFSSLSSTVSLTATSSSEFPSVTLTKYRNSPSVARSATKSLSLTTSNASLPHTRSVSLTRTTTRSASDSRSQSSTHLTVSPSRYRTPTRVRTASPTTTVNDSTFTSTASATTSATIHHTASPGISVSATASSSTTWRTSARRRTLTASLSLTDSSTWSRSASTIVSLSAREASITSSESPIATPTLRLLPTPSLCSSSTHTKSRTYVPPPPPTVAPKILECTGRANVILSYNTSTPLVVPLTTALTAAYVFTLQITSCHTFGAALYLEAVRSGGGRVATGSISQQSTTLKGKKLTLIVGPLSPYVPDASESVLVTIGSPLGNTSSLFSPSAMEGVGFAISTTGSTSNVTLMTNATALPNATVQFTASATSLSTGTVAAMQAGVTSVTVVTVVVSSPALAGSAQRQALLTNVAECPNPIDATENTLSFTSHPLQFPIGSSLVRFNAGSMVGDLVVMIGIVLLHAAVTCVCGFRYKEVFWVAAWRTRFPTMTMPVISIFSQSCMNGALVTLFYGDEVGTTIGSVVILLVVVAGLLMVVQHTVNSLRRESRFAEKPTIRRLERAALVELKERKEIERRVTVAMRKDSAAAIRLHRADAQQVSEASVAKGKRRRTYSTAERMGTWGQSLRHFITSLSRARGFWTPVTHPEVLHIYGGMFEELDPSGVYFMWVEVLQNVVSVAILSYIPTTVDGCRNQFIAVLIVLTIYAALSVAIRPYLSRVANVIACSIAILQGIAAWTLFIAFQLDDGSWMTAYAALNFATLGVQVLAALHGLAKTLWEVNSGKDALSRGLSMWTALDARGLPFLEKLHSDGALATWPMLDPVIHYKLASQSETPHDDEREVDTNADDLMKPHQSLRALVSGDAQRPKQTAADADDLLLANVMSVSGEYSNASASDYGDEMEERGDFLRQSSRTFRAAPPTLPARESADGEVPLVMDATDELLQFLDEARATRMHREGLL